MILYRYIIREHILPFLYALSVLMFIFVMQLAVELLHKILSKGLALSVVFEIFALNMAWMMALAVPMAVLIATLMAFGKMSADNEILAIKASGQNLFFLITPVVAAAALIALLLVFFNNLIYPDANHKAAGLQSDIARKRPAAMIEPDILIRDFPHYALHVGEINHRSGKMRDVKIFSDRPGEDPSTTVADSGMIQVTRDERFLQLTLHDGETHSINATDKEEYFLGRFDRQVIFIDNIDDDLQRTERTYRGDREKSAQMMLKDIAGYREKQATLGSKHQPFIDSLATRITHLDSLAATLEPDTADTAAPADFAAWAGGVESAARHGAASQLKRQGYEIKRAMRGVERERMRISQYLVEVHKKYSIPVACVVFVLIGAPLGIMARHGGLAVAASYSIFFFILYWAFLIGGETMADKLVVSPGLAMWSANIVLGFCGALLIVRMVRETTFISFGPLARAWTKLRGAIAKPRHHARRGILTRLLFGVPLWVLNRSAGILPAYLLRIFIVNLIYVFIALSVIFVVVDYISNMRVFDEGTPRDIVLYYWYYLHWFVKLISPIAILLASMFSVGSMAKHSELVAIKAAGVNVRRLSIPLLFLGMVLAASDFYMGERLLPHANTRRKELYQIIREGRDAHQGAAERARNLHRNFYYFGDNTTVYGFQEFRAAPLHTKNVWRERFEGNRIAERIQAETMLYQQGRWSLVDGRRRVFQGDSAVLHPFDTLHDTILTASPEDMVARIKGVDEMSYWELQAAIDKARGRGEPTQKYQADLDFKIALPFMNMIVILLGISITARAGRKGVAVLFGIGLLLCFSYWVLARFGLAMGQNGKLPPLAAAWLGNAVYLLIGLFLYRKASR
jgi:lipopolysaccharide export system permease protein